MTRSSIVLILLCLVLADARAQTPVRLTLDGAQVGTYMASDLAAGVNLGNLGSGPLYERANLVYQAINVIGYYHWSGEERRLKRASVVDEAPALAWAGEPA